MVLSNEDIGVIKDYFQDKPVLKAFLFGSFARNEGSNESDIFILVELDYSKHIGLGCINMKFDLEDRLHKKIDIVQAMQFLKTFFPS